MLCLIYFYCPVSGFNPKSLNDGCWGILMNFESVEGDQLKDLKGFWVTNSNGHMVNLMWYVCLRNLQKSPHLKLAFPSTIISSQSTFILTSSTHKQIKPIFHSISKWISICHNIIFQAENQLKIKFIFNDLFLNSISKKKERKEICPK